MKRVIIVLLVCFLCACGNTNSNLSNSNHETRDMEEAKSLVIDYFNQYFDGCTLIDISYDEDVLEEEQDYKNENDYEEIIILKMKFKTDDNQIVLNNNSEYEYSAMVGKKDGKWGIVEGMVGQG